MPLVRTPSFDPLRDLPYSGKPPNQSVSVQPQNISGYTGSGNRVFQNAANIPVSGLTSWTVVLTSTPAANPSLASNINPVLYRVIAVVGGGEILLAINYLPVTYPCSVAHPFTMYADYVKVDLSSCGAVGTGINDQITVSLGAA